MSERAAIDRGWFYVQEPDNGAHLPASRRIIAPDGRVLSRRLHGFAGNIRVFDESGASLPRATLLRAASAIGHGLEMAYQARDARIDIVLGPAGTTKGVRPAVGGRMHVTLDGPALASAPSHHPLTSEIMPMLTMVMPPIGDVPVPSLPTCQRVLFFESLMNTDMPHNDREISQGVLHMASQMRAMGVDVVLANVKMAITGEDRSAPFLDGLDAALQGPPIGLICITLLEGYFDGVVRLIEAIRERGCRAHIAVGGVMPTLAPEHVMAHLPDVSFVCRGDGEVH